MRLYHDASDIDTTYDLPDVSGDDYAAAAADLFSVTEAPAQHDDETDTDDLATEWHEVAESIDLDEDGATRKESPRVDYSDKAFETAMRAAGLPILPPEGMAFCRDRAISPDVAAARGIRVGAGAAALPDPGEGRNWSRAVRDHASVSGVRFLILPWQTPRGIVPQIKWLPNPRVSGEGDDAVSHKYEFPASDRDENGDKLTGRVIDTMHYRHDMEVHIVAEGQGKTDHIATALPGASILGIAGVDGGSLGRGKGTMRSVGDLASEFVEAAGGRERIADEVFVLVPDSDVTTNQNVFEAYVGRLGRSLAAAGAYVLVCLVPSEVADPIGRRYVRVTTSGEAGIDDYAVAHAEHYPDDRTLAWRMLYDVEAGFLVHFNEAMRRWGMGYATTDAGRGEALADQIAETGDWYLPRDDEWMTWTGKQYVISKRSHVMYPAARECAGRVWGKDKADTTKRRAEFESSAAMDRAIGQAKAHQAIHSDKDGLQPREFAHYWPAANGTVNLTTGELEEDVWHREHMNPFIGDVAYVPGARSDAWDAFLRRVVVTKVEEPEDGVEYVYDRDGIAYEYDEAKASMLQRYVGTWLTARNFRLGAFFIGSGQSGMSTFAEMLTSVMAAEVRGVMPAEALTTKQGTSNQFTSGRLAGQRVVIPSEMREKMTLDDAKWKAWTQDGDRIDVEEKGKQARSIHVTWSLPVLTNDEPGLDRKAKIDNSMKSRALMITFPRGISAEQISADASFMATLKGDDVKRAILAWMVEGAVAFYAAGQNVGQTEESKALVKKWLSRGDKYAGLISTCLRPRDAQDTETKPLTRADLYAAYVEYANAEWSGRYLSERDFYAEVSSRAEFGEAKRGKGRDGNGNRINLPAQWAQWTLSAQGRRFVTEGRF